MSPRPFPNLDQYHRADAGLLNVIFSHFGRIKEGPHFTGPVRFLDQRGRQEWLSIVSWQHSPPQDGITTAPEARTHSADSTSTLLGGVALSELTLDPRLPEVSGRLALLAALALGEAPGSWALTRSPGWMQRDWADFILSAPEHPDRRWAWSLWGRCAGCPSGQAAVDICGLLDLAGISELDALDVLIGLVLTLAGKIVALAEAEAGSPETPA